jgi:hypothetical protein
MKKLLIILLIFAGCDKGIERWLNIPPETIIISHPQNPTNSTSATFEFTCKEGNCTFECKLDNESWEPCSSPKTYSGLSEGFHTFYVRAKNLAGKVDETPASYSWTIGGLGPVCGNGVCESGETKTSCPEDCGPVLWLKFDECSGSTAYDSSGKGNNGAINGATWVNLGGGNCVLSFDGVDDYVEIPDSSFFDSSKMTIEAWFNVSSCPSGEPTDIVSKHSYPGDVQMLFRLEADCKLDIEWTIGDKFYDLSYGSCPPSNSYCDDEVGIYNVTLNTWYHGVAVYDGNEIILYVNGQKIKSIEASGEIVKNSLPIIIGGSGLAWSQESFAGEIDEVRIYPTALSGDTILEHYQNEKERYP